MKSRIIKILAIAATIGLGVLGALAVTPANAQTNPTYPDSLCADIVDTIRMSNGYITEQRWEVKAGLEDMFINELNSDWDIMTHWQRLESIRNVELEIELLDEMYLDNCEDKYYD